MLLRLLAFWAAENKDGGAGNKARGPCRWQFTSFGDSPNLRGSSSCRALPAGSATWLFLEDPMREARGLLVCSFSCCALPAGSATLLFPGRVKLELMAMTLRIAELNTAAIAMHAHYVLLATQLALLQAKS